MSLSLSLTLTANVTMKVCLSVCVRCVLITSLINYYSASIPHLEVYIYIIDIRVDLIYLTVCDLSVYLSVCLSVYLSIFIQFIRIHILA